jgi:transposase
MDDSKPCKNCDGLARKNIELEIKIKKLESKLSYYENPNSPPSSDSIYWRKQKKERKTENHSKPGQKPGHKGTTHSFKTTKTINHTTEKCSRCGSKNIIQTTQQSRIIAEIPKPSPITVTKHVIPSYLCKNCGVVTTVAGIIPKKGCLGFNLIGIITSLWSARITVRNIAKMIQSFYSIKLSASCINNSLYNTSLALEPFVQQIRKDISSSDFAHFDETKYSINGDTGWIWTAVNHNSCFITVENSRGRNVLQQHFGSFTGVAVCDGWLPYKIFNIRQRCWAHILREAKHYSEKLDTVNSVSLYHYLQKLFFVTTSSKTKEPNQSAYDSSIKLLERIILEYSNDESLQKFLTKLNNAKDDLFTFLLYDTVEPTNNTAEHALREPIIHRKIRGCVRNQKGCRMFGNLMSCIMTWKMRDCNLLDEIVKYV